MLRVSPTDRREEFAQVYAFGSAFPESHPSHGFLRVLCQLYLDASLLGDLEDHFQGDNSLDPAWLGASPLDPFITNDPPAYLQVSSFHKLLEDTLAARQEGRVDDALQAYERFARMALQWSMKPDVMLHDFLTEVEPYCAGFAGIVLRKFHLTPDPPPGYGWDDRREPRPESVSGEDDPARPERDLSGLTGFGHAPPVAQEVHVYVDLQWVDGFQASRAASPEELENEERQRARVRAILGDRSTRESIVVQKGASTKTCSSTRSGHKQARHRKAAQACWALS